MEPTPTLVNQVSGLEYHLGTPHNLLTNLTPTNRGPTFPHVEHLKRRLINAGMITVVICDIPKITARKDWFVYALFKNMSNILNESVAEFVPKQKYDKDLSKAFP